MINRLKGGTYMSYLEPFQSIALFENTFRHQLNKKTGKIDE